MRHAFSGGEPDRSGLPSDEARRRAEPAPSGRQRAAVEVPQWYLALGRRRAPADEVAAVLLQKIEADEVEPREALRLFNDAGRRIPGSGAAFTARLNQDVLARLARRG